MAGSSSELLRNAGNGTEQTDKMPEFERELLFFMYPATTIAYEAQYTGIID